MGGLSTLIDGFKNAKKKIAEMLCPDELSKIAYQTGFIQRTTALLQGKDFVELMTTVSMDPKAVSLEGLCSTLRELNPEADLTHQLNIAEGAGEYAVEEKIRFYRMAKRSATECAGILDVCQRLQLLDEQHHTKGRELLIRIVSMLIKMARR